MGTPNYFLGVSADWTNTSNWSAGVVPAATHDPIFAAGIFGPGVNINLPTTGLAHDRIVVERGFGTQIGSGNAGWEIGSVGEVVFQGDNCPGFWIEADNGATVGLVRVIGTALGDSAMILDSNGTGAYNRIVIEEAQRVAIRAPVANLAHVANRGRPQNSSLETGASITGEVVIAGGVCKSYISATTATTSITIAGGIFENLGDTNFSVARFNVYGGELRLFDSGGTYTRVDQHGGVVNANGGPGRVRTIGTYNGYGGTLDKSGNGTTLTITTNNAYGVIVKQA